MISVVGGSGFIGTRLCQDLSDRQVPFEIIDLKASSRFPDKTKIADIRDISALSSSISGNKIIHLAAVHRDDVRDKSLYYSTNVEGTRNICAVAEERGIEDIVFTSTVAVYGFAKESTGEDGKIDPFNDYGKSKFEGEETLRAWQAAKGRNNLTIIRPTVVFGEGNRGNVYNLLRQISSGFFVMVGKGTNRKSMAYVGNVSEFLRCATETGSGYRLYNYVDKPDFDMNTLVELVRNRLRDKTGTGFRLPYWIAFGLGFIADVVAALTGKSFVISRIRVKKFSASTMFASAADQMEGFAAPYTLEDALARTLKAEFIDPDPAREVFYTE